MRAADTGVWGQVWEAGAGQHQNEPLPAVLCSPAHRKGSRERQYRINIVITKYEVYGNNTCTQQMSYGLVVG